MTLADAGPLISAVMQLVAQIVSAINSSIHMSEEEKKQAIAALTIDLDATAQKVKNVRFDALKEGNKAT